jgi:hypothetical protein
MVFNALQQVSQQLGIEKLHRQLHQLDKEVGYQRYIDAGTDMQQDPAADKVDACAPDNQH